MATHYEVCRRFIERGRPLKGNNVYTSADNKTIYSYGNHFPMAHIYDDRKLILINGDRASHTTNRHQSDLRGAIESYGQDFEKITLPFSVINRANIIKESIVRLDEGEEINEAYCHTCDVPLSTKYPEPNSFWNHANSEKHEKIYRHLLAPSLFKTSNGFYLSGFDETGIGFGGGYFFTKLPRRVNTIEEAYLSLQPERVKKALSSGVEVKRQGDIFAIPTDITTRKLKSKGRIMPLRKLVTLTAWDSDKVLDYRETDVILGPYTNIRNGLRPQLLDTNHYATEAFMVERNGKQTIYARGSLYHRPGWRRPDHKVIKLGKQWHEIHKNTALGNWTTEGRVD